MKATGKGYFAENYSEDDLSATIVEYADVPELKPPMYAVKLAPGHEDDEKLLDRTDLPAMGWPERLYRQGDKLMADVSQVPDVVENLLKQGAYKKVSAEIYPDLEYDGKHFGPALRRIGVLGAEIPEVKTLADIPTPANGRITGLEVFEAGTHHGKYWSPRDLDVIVANFDRLRKGKPSKHAEVKGGAFIAFTEKRPMAKPVLPKISLAKLKAATFSEAQKAIVKKFADAPADQAAPTGTSKEEMLALLAQAGLDVAALGSLDDAALAEVVRYVSSMKGEMDAMAAPPATKLADTPAPTVTPAPLPTITPTPTPAPAVTPASVTVKLHSENGQEKTMTQAEFNAYVKAAVAAELKPMQDKLAGGLKDFDSFAETTRKNRIDTELAQLVKDGKVLPAQIEAGLRDRLVRADAVHKFSDGQTELEKQLAELRAGPCVFKFGERVKDPATVESEANAEVQKVAQFAESNAAALKAAGQTPKQFVATFKEMQKKRPELKASDIIGTRAA